MQNVPVVVDKNNKSVTITGDDSFLSFLMQAAQNSNLLKMRKIQEDEVSQGWIQSFNVALNNSQVYEEFAPDIPGQSIFVVNDGPGAGSQVLLRINNASSTDNIINLNGTYQTDFGGHKLVRFYVRCSVGAVANIRCAVRG